MSSLSQQAIQELFHRVAQRYFKLSSLIDPTNEEKIAIYEKELSQLPHPQGDGACN